MTDVVTYDALNEFLRARILDRTGVDASVLTDEAVLVEIGLQSIDAVLICGEVEDKFSIELDPSMMFEFRTLKDVLGAIMKAAEA